jgi:hypothetical protein
MHGLVRELSHYQLLHGASPPDDFSSASDLSATNFRQWPGCAKSWLGI